MHYFSDPIVWKAATLFFMLVWVVSASLYIARVARLFLLSSLLASSVVASLSYGVTGFLLHLLAVTVVIPMCILLCAYLIESAVAAKMRWQGGHSCQGRWFVSPSEYMKSRPIANLYQAVML